MDYNRLVMTERDGNPALKKSEDVTRAVVKVCKKLIMVFSPNKSRVQREEDKETQLFIFTQIRRRFITWIVNLQSEDCLTFRFTIYVLILCLSSWKIVLELKKEICETGFAPRTDSYEPPSPTLYSAAIGKAIL